MLKRMETNIMENIKHGSELSSEDQSRPEERGDANMDRHLTLTTPVPCDAM